jgi:uncharacterized protein (TIRG00374 family)
MEVLFDGISLILLMYVSSFVFDFPPWIREAEIYVAIGLAVVLLLLITVLRNERALKYFGKTRIRRRFPRLYRKLQKWTKSISDGLETLKSGAQILKVGFFSVLVWVFHVGIAISLIMAFDLDVPSWAGVVVIIVNSVLLLVPISPGNIGSFQIAVIAALAMFRVPKAEAAAFSLVMHFMDVFPVFAIGFIFLFTDHLAFRQLREETVQEAAVANDQDPNQP